MNNQKLIILSFIILILFIGIIRWWNYLLSDGYIIENMTNSINFEKYNSATNYPVDVPLNSTITCKNMCGPNDRCYLTGEQCTSDIDCYGCRPTFNNYLENNKKHTNYLLLDDSEETTIYDEIGNNSKQNNNKKNKDNSNKVTLKPNKEHTKPKYALSTREAADLFKVQNMKIVNMHGDNDAGKLTSAVTPNYSILTTDIGTTARVINTKDSKPPFYYQGVNTWRDTFDEGSKYFDKRYTPTASQFTSNYPKRHTLSGEFVNDGPLAANEFLQGF